MGAYAWSKIEIPRLRKRQYSAPGSLSQLSPREAERQRDGYDSTRTPGPAYSYLVSRASRMFPRMRMRVRKWAGEGKDWADLPGFCDSVVCAEYLPRVHND